MGCIDNSKVIFCSVEADSMSQMVARSSIGGLVGCSADSGSLIENCTVVWDIEAESGWSVGGGVVGDNYGSVENCYQNGDITVSGAATNAYAGGIAGRSDSAVTLLNNWSTGSDAGTTTDTYVTSGITPLLAALNGWVDDDTTNGSGYASWSEDTDNINDGYPILADVGTEMKKP